MTLCIMKSETFALGASGKTLGRLNVGDVFLLRGFWIDSGERVKWRCRRDPLLVATNQYLMLVPSSLYPVLTCTTQYLMLVPSGLYPVPACITQYLMASIKHPKPKLKVVWIFRRDFKIVFLEPFLTSNQFLVENALLIPHLNSNARSPDIHLLNTCTLD